MKTLFLALAVLAAPAFATGDKPPPVAPPSVPEDRWDGEDKKLHFAVSALAGLGCSQLFPHDFGKGFTCAMIPGLVKEFADSQTKGNKWSNKDIAANALGAALGVGVGNWIITPTKVYYHAQF